MSINLFDVNVYRAANPDLATVGLTTDAQLSQHFQNFGINEGRRFSLFADLSFYRSSNPDLAAAGINTNRQLLDHLQNFGVREGRRFSPFVDTNFYLAANPDVATAFNNNREQALMHLETNGLSEGRQFSQFFNPNYYRENNPDLAAVGLNTNQQLLQHFEIYGVNETRQFSIPFDTNYYRNAYADLKSLNNRDLFNQFEIFGLNEGRASSQFFNVSYYLANNSDLKTQNFNNYQAYNHFVLHGLSEGRFGSADGYPGHVNDNGDGTATPIFLASPQQPGNYSVPGGFFNDGQSHINEWQQKSGRPWSAEANVQFTNGQPTQNIPLSIYDDNQASGNKTIIWKIPSNAPFGFSQATYSFSEKQQSASIQLKLGSNVKTATITIQDIEVLTTLSSTDVPRSIPDTNATLSSNLVVSGLPTSIKDVNVTLNINHPHDSDLHAVLISPKGTQVGLFQNIGGNGTNFTKTTFDDQALTSISSGTAPFTGSFEPQENLSKFNSENPNGTWKLQIDDNKAGDMGTLTSWSVTFTTA